MPPLGPLETFFEKYTPSKYLRMALTTILGMLHAPPSSTKNLPVAKYGLSLVLNYVGTY